MGQVLAWVGLTWPVLLVDVLLVALAVRTLRQLRGATAKHARSAARFPELEKGRKVNPQSVEVAQAALTDVVERGIRALEALDRKATLIPPALGLAAGIVVPRISPSALDEPLGWASGLSALAAGLVATATALAVFFPRGYRAGPDPIDGALGTGDRETAYRQGVANALARAAVSIEGVVTHRAALFFLSVVFLGGTILLLTIFGINGGFAGGAARPDA